MTDIVPVRTTGETEHIAITAGRVSARDLQAHFGYASWQKFAVVVSKAEAAFALVHGETAASEQLIRTDKLSPLPNGGYQTIKDWSLTVQAALFCAADADSRKPSVARAKAELVAARIMIENERRSLTVKERVGLGRVEVAMKLAEAALGKNEVALKNADVALRNADVAIKKVALEHEKIAERRERVAFAREKSEAAQNRARTPAGATASTRARRAKPAANVLFEDEQVPPRNYPPCSGCERAMRGATHDGFCVECRSALWRPQA